MFVGCGVSGSDDSSAFSAEVGRGGRFLVAVDLVVLIGFFGFGILSLPPELFLVDGLTVSLSFLFLLLSGYTGSIS